MKDYRELRSHERIDLDTPVLFYENDVTDHHKAMMQNFSEQGMYMESEEYVRPGATVFVKTINYRSVDKYQVRWCNRISGMEGQSFGIGLQSGLSLEALNKQPA